MDSNKTVYHAEIAVVTMNAQGRFPSSFSYESEGIASIEALKGSFPGWLQDLSDENHFENGTIMDVTMTIVDEAGEYVSSDECEFSILDGKVTQAE